MFRNRLEAGRKLGDHLRGRVRPPAVVLGIPRGGVVVAGPVADALGAPLDVVVPRKLGAPGEPELAIGALAVVDGRDILIVDETSLRRLQVPAAYVMDETERQRQEIARRVAAYRGSRPPVPLAACTVVIVDDGIATGLTARAAAEAVAGAGAGSVLIAVPVAPRETLAAFSRLGVRIEALEAPEPFMAVGQFYADFASVEDAEVVAVLRARGGA